MKNLIVKNCKRGGNGTFPTLEQTAQAVYYDGTAQCVEQMRNQFSSEKYPMILRNAQTVMPHSYIVWNNDMSGVVPVNIFKKLYEVESTEMQSISCRDIVAKIPLGNVIPVEFKEQTPAKVWYDVEYTPTMEVSMYDRLADIMNILEIEHYNMVCVGTESARIDRGSATFLVTPTKIEVSFKSMAWFADNVYMAVHDHLEDTCCHINTFTEHMREIGN